MQILVIFLCIALIVFLLENLRELKCFRVKKYKIISRKLRGNKPVKILFLSDLHNCSYGDENMRLLQAVKMENPGIILIGGDMLVRKNGSSYEKTVEFLKKLSKICTVYYANGNHEQKLKEQPENYHQSYQSYKEELIKAGIVFLENETAEVCLDKVKIRITGLEIPITAYRRFGRENLRKEDFEKKVGRPNPFYHILLAHNPVYTEQYLEWGADLVLSGHLHGGLIGFPGIGGVIAPDFRLFPKYSGGRYNKKGKTVIVSRGLGCHSVPIRFLNPAELVSLELIGDR